jgi:DNA-binding CsgD family transcriptional regulator
MGTSPTKHPRLSGADERATLLERDAEVSLIERLLADAPAGRGALLLLQGPAGIGKSRLLSAARKRAEELGFSVLHARGGEFEREFPHGVVRQLYEVPLASANEDERERRLAGAARLAAPLFEFSHARAEPAGAENASAATLHGLYWLTANIAERAPALLAVDDLHWADLPSLRFVSYLARRLDGLPVVVAASVRTGEPVADEAILAELEAEPVTTVVRPAPLSFEAVSQLLGSALAGDIAPEFLRAVDTACHGNPLLLTELVHAVLAEGIEPTAHGAERVRGLGPDTLSRFVLRRLRALGRAAESLARAVAVLGGESDLTLAAELATLELEDAAAAGARLARAEILRPRWPTGFVHPVLRAAVYAELSESERALAHDRAAELLAAAGAPPQQVAAHLVHAPPRSRNSVVATLRDAARRAGVEGAADAAAAYLERALAEPPDAAQRANVLLELGAAELRAGLPGATGHLQEAFELLDGEPPLADAALALANALYSAGRLGDAADVLQRAIERLDPGDVALVQRLDAELIMWARLDARHYHVARERLARVAEHVSEDSFGGRHLLALAASELARAGEAPAEARALAERALVGDLLLGEESSLAYATAVAVLVSLDELDVAVRRYTDWLELARARGSAFGFASASLFRALALLRRGDLPDAEADARTAFDAILPLVGESGHLEFRAYLAETLAERGELAEALRVLEPANDAGESLPSYQTARRLDARARLRIAAGDAERGLDDLLAAGKRLEALGVRNPSHSPWRSAAALVLLEKGDRAEARRLVHEEAKLARGWGAARPLGAALRAAGLVEAGADGLDLLRESVTVLESSPALLERAKSLTELGAALRRANHRAEARRFLQDGLELAHRCGAVPVADRAHAELLATGARPRRLVRTGVDSLTASERRVAQLAAEGRTNREIAQALFVTPKTVEMHLSHVYRKLEIQARSQLAGAMAKL